MAKLSRLIIEQYLVESDKRFMHGCYNEWKAQRQDIIGDTLRFFERRGNGNMRNSKQLNLIHQRLVLCDLTASQYFGELFSKGDRLYTLLIDYKRELTQRANNSLQAT